MSTQAAPFVLTGRKVLVILVCFFGTVVAANAVLTVSAVRSFSGVEVPSAYAAGQLYNRELALARAQDARHWALALAATRNPDGSVRVSADLRGATGEPLRGRSVTAVLERPTDRREDVRMDLSEAAPGRYGADVTGLAAGQWDLVVDVLEGSERAYRRRARVVLP